MKLPVQAIISNLPMSELDTVREHFKLIAKEHGRKLRIRYRGPRRKTASGRTTYAGQLTCLKADATSFSVYLD